MSAFYSPAVSFDYCRSFLASCIMHYRCSLHRKCYHLFLYCISCVYLLPLHLPLRDVLPFTLKLPEAIASAKTQKELEEVAQLGAGSLTYYSATMLYVLKRFNYGF